MYVCMYVYISVCIYICLSVFKYVFHYLILSVEACMEIVKDQGEHATAGWTGFQNKPTSKETAQRAVDLLGKMWFYTEVIIFLTGDTLPDSLLYMLKLKINFTSEKKRRSHPHPIQKKDMFLHKRQRRWVSAVVMKQGYSRISSNDTFSKRFRL